MFFPSYEVPYVLWATNFIITLRTVGNDRDALELSDYDRKFCVLNVITSFKMFTITHKTCMIYIYFIIILVVTNANPLPITK
jgi:hypothetical protein